MNKAYLQLMMLMAAAEILLAGCGPFDNDPTPVGSADTTPANESPTVFLINTITTIAEDIDLSSSLPVTDIVIRDDATGTNTLSVSGTDAGLFEIVGDELHLRADTVLDFETSQSLNVNVEVDDSEVGSSPDDTASLSIEISDVNEAPAVALSNTATNLAEDTDTSSAVRVADIVITDDALGSTVLLLSGADADLFAVVGAQLQMVAGTALDFESQASFEVQVEVGDPDIGATPDGAELLVINITDVNEAPMVSLTNAATEFPEDTDTSASIVVADIVIADDALGMNTLSISGADSALFKIVGTELRLIDGALLDFESNPNLDASIEIDDAAVGPMPDDSEPISIAITDILEILQFVNGQDASVVIGQPDFVSDGHNQDGFVAGNSFDYTYGSAGFGNSILYLPDFYNYRVLGFTGVPTVNNQPADFVLGQNAFTTADEETGAVGIDCPTNAAYADDRLLVVDCSYSRGALYEPAPTMGPVAAAIAIGQLDFGGDGSACTQTGLSLPEAGTLTPDGQLIVADSDNHRVMIWNSIPAASGAPADIVLGQLDFTSCERNAPASAPTARNFDFPAGVWSDGEKLVVLDHYNNRAMIWTSFPTTNGQVADLVLGQGDFTHNAINDDDQDNIPNLGPSARTLNAPYLGVDYNGLQLCIADSGNSRVLVWDEFPTSNFQPADRVLGQADFVSGIYDRGGPVAANTLDRPSGCRFIGSQIVVSDTENSRFLLYEEP